MAEDIHFTIGYDNSRVRKAAKETEQVMSAAQSRINQSTSTMGSSAGTSMKRNMGQMALQVQDIGVQLQGGQKLMTVVTQQGTQMLSVLGPGGMIAGGLLAVGGLVYSFGQKSKEAFETATKATGDLRVQTSRLVGSADLPTMVKHMESLRDASKSLQDQRNELNHSYFGPLKALMAGQMPGTKNAELTKNIQDIGRSQAQSQLYSLELSDKELKIANLRAQGRTKEADEVERQLKLREKLAAIDALPFAPNAREQMKQNATLQSKAEAQAKVRGEVEKNKEAAQGLAAQMAAKEAQLSGRKREAKKIMENEALRQRGNQIAQELGIDPKDAADIAKREKKLQDDLDKKAKGKIFGAKSGQTKRGFKGLDDREFKALDAFNKLQEGGIHERRNAAFGKGDPLDKLLQSRRNVVRPDPKNDKPNVAAPGVEAKIEALTKLIEARLTVAN